MIYFVPLTTSKVLPFENKNTNFSIFILYSSHLFVPLTSHYE